MSGCDGCPKKPICNKICPYIESMLYVNKEKVCIHNKSICFHDVGLDCNIGDPDNLYSGDVDLLIPCGEQRCSGFLGCRFGHEQWVSECNADRCGGCDNFALAQDTNTYKYGIECGFKKEVAYDSNIIDIIKNKLSTYFGLISDSDDDIKMPQDDLLNIIYIDGLDCKTCKLSNTCIALKLCGDMSNALSSIIDDGVEEEIDGNMRVKMLTGSKFVDPEIRLKMIKLLKCEKFLPKRQRDCLWLFYIDGMHQKDIAQALSSYNCANENCAFFSPIKVDVCPRCGSIKFNKSNITSQAVNRYIKWGLSNIRKKFLLDLELFDIIEYNKKCSICKKEFVTGYKHQNYCTIQCRVKYYTNKRRKIRRRDKKRKKVKSGGGLIKCAYHGCDVTFIPSPYQKYHSKACRLKAARETYKIKIPSISDHSHLIKRR